MNNSMIIGEWKPEERFNILDVRDFKTFPQYDPPPYVFKFNFSNTHEPIEIHGIVMDILGWNIPECRTNVLFSKIQVSKNGYNDIYYNKKEGSINSNNLTLNFDRNMVISSLNDVLVISLFPLCRIHMIYIERIAFLSISAMKKLPENSGSNIDENEYQKHPLFSYHDPYWYLYATLVVMILFLLISLLFMVINNKQKRHYIVIRPKK